MNDTFFVILTLSKDMAKLQKRSYIATFYTDFSFLIACKGIPKRILCLIFHLTNTFCTVNLAFCVKEGVEALPR